MKWLLLVLFSFILSYSQVFTKAFPGAEGYGAYSAGGRGGRTIYVTNLNDTGSGSLRDACVFQSGPRTVVFAVSGVIALKTLIVISNPYITIAGQTSPMNGITLTSSGIYIKTHDVTIRYIRSRPGDTTAGTNPDDRDAFTIGEGSYNVILDHVSASWAIDENMSTWYAPHDLTIQWSIISEGLSKSIHPQDSPTEPTYDGVHIEHSKAMLVGDSTKRLSMHHNYMAHNMDRNPQMKDGSNLDFFDNIVYDWGYGGFSFAYAGTAGPARGNLVDCYYKRGPSTTGSFFGVTVPWTGTQIYVMDDIGDDPLLIAYNQNPSYYISFYPFLASSLVDWTGNINYTKIDTTYNRILNYVGAIKPKRDSIDIRVIKDFTNITGRIIDSQRDVGGYPKYTPFIMSTSQLNSFDSDHDGIPNSVEIKYGLNPYNAADANYIRSSDGYTNLEVYLNSL